MGKKQRVLSNYFTKLPSKARGPKVQEVNDDSSSSAKNAASSKRRRVDGGINNGELKASASRLRNKRTKQSSESMKADQPMREPEKLNDAASGDKMKLDQTSGTKRKASDGVSKKSKFGKKKPRTPLALRASNREAGGVRQTNEKNIEEAGGSHGGRDGEKVHGGGERDPGHRRMEVEDAEQDESEEITEALGMKQSGDVRGDEEKRIDGLFEKARETDASHHAKIMKITSALGGGGGGGGGGGDCPHNDNDEKGEEEDVKARAGGGSSTKKKKKTKKKQNPSEKKYTPMEKQVIELKRRYPDVLLAVEVGYKYQFFGEDAERAAKQLDLWVGFKNNMKTCSFPVTRIGIHMKRLVEAGFKVGVVTQTETAAIKKHAKSSGLFKRDVTKLYTKATLIEDDDGKDATITQSSSSSSGGGNAASKSTSRYIVCILESPNRKFFDAKQDLFDAEKVSSVFMAVEPASGDVVWDVFEDDFTRTQLETRLTSIRPSEILLPAATNQKMKKKNLEGEEEEETAAEITIGNARGAVAISKFSGKLLNYYCATSSSSVRVEILDPRKFSFKDESSQMLSALSEFYSSILSSSSSSNNNNDGGGGEGGGCGGGEEELDPETSSPPPSSEPRTLENALGMPRNALICLAALVKYLTDFKLQHLFRNVEQFRRFAAGAGGGGGGPMLDGLALKNLEILTNEDGGTKGSLLWLLSHCRTKFGARILRRWVANPLKDRDRILHRLDAVSGSS